MFRLSTLPALQEFGITCAVGTILVFALSLTALPASIVIREKYYLKNAVRKGETEDSTIAFRIRELLDDWVQGIRELVAKLQSWGMASAQAAQVLEWALDNNIGARTNED